MFFHFSFSLVCLAPLQHLDLRYVVASDIKQTSCHAENGSARALGERFFCDSPEDLVDKSLYFASMGTSPDFVLLTGDLSRHDDYAAVPRTWAEILQENTKGERREHA